MINAILIIFFSASAIILVLDIILALKGKATFSMWLYGKSKEQPIIPALLCFVMGLLVGHWFWQMHLCQ